MLTSTIDKSVPLAETRTVTMEGEFFSEDSDTFYTADDASVGKSSACGSVVGESSAWDVQDSVE